MPAGCFGQHSGLIIVPDRGFALTALTNSVGGPQLTQELFDDDWALRTFAGLSNVPAVPQVLSPRQLAPYEGRYEAEMIEPDGALTKTVYWLRADNGYLRRHERRDRGGTSCPLPQGLRLGAR